MSRRISGKGPVPEQVRLRRIDFKAIVSTAKMYRVSGVPVSLLTLLGKNYYFRYYKKDIDKLARMIKDKIFDMPVSYIINY